MSDGEHRLWSHLCHVISWIWVPLGTSGRHESVRFLSAAQRGLNENIHTHTRNKETKVANEADDVKETYNLSHWGNILVCKEAVISIVPDKHRFIQNFKSRTSRYWPWPYNLNKYIWWLRATFTVKTNFVSQIPSWTNPVLWNYIQTV